jgi:hypothetical protein
VTRHNIEAVRKHVPVWQPDTFEVSWVSFNEIRPTTSLPAALRRRKGWEVIEASAVLRGFHSLTGMAIFVQYIIVFDRGCCRWFLHLRRGRWYIHTHGSCWVCSPCMASCGRAGWLGRYLESHTVGPARYVAWWRENYLLWRTANQTRFNGNTRLVAGAGGVPNRDAHQSLGHPGSLLAILDCRVFPIFLW